MNIPSCPIKCCHQLSILLSLFLCLYNRPAVSQTVKYEVSGRVTTTTGKGVFLASIGLFRTSDSTLVKGEVSDSSGYFMFKNILPGRYYISAASMGHSTVVSMPFDVRSNTTAPSLIMEEQVKSLKGVDVVSKKPFIQQTPDKTILNVENSIVSKGASATDVLDMAPGVNIDVQEKRISMGGREGVLIMIDNKPTYLSPQEALGLLSSMPSNSIQSIELITNPSSRYDAAGNAGIINIRLKKNTQLHGLNGSVTAGVGYGVLPKLNGGASLNFRSNKINLFSNYNIDYRENFVQMDVERLFYTANGNTTLHTLGYWPSQDLTHTVKAGADYSLSDKQVLGIMVNGSFSNNDNQLRNDNYQYLGNQVLDNTSFVNLSTRRSNRFAANANYKYTISKAGDPGGLRELSIDADYSRNSIKPSDDMTTDFTDSKLLQTNNYPSIVNIKSVKADYLHSFTKNTIAEVGWKSSFVNSDNDVVFRELEQGTWKIDSGRTNHFLYEENIHAGYASLNHTIGRWSLKAGVRVEHTQSTGQSLTDKNRFERKYTDLFPSASVSWQINKSNTIGLSYNRRIDRPNYQDLNPFVYVLDPFSDFAGNSFLLPQYTNSIQASYTHRNRVNVSLGYNRTSDVIVTIRTQDPVTNKLTVQTDNFGTLNNINLSIGFPVTITKWWNMRQSADIFYNQYNYQEGVPFKFEKLTASLKMNNSFSLPWNLSGELTASYVSPRIAGVTYFDEVWQVNAGLQRSFWKKSASLNLAFNDIFHSIRFRRSVDYLNTHMRVNNYQDTRNVRLTFIYNFGNKSLKSARQRKAGLEDEQKRVGNSI
ncbi:TonB-dependent receptor domain-containing protein [Chitinophaga rhizophila]|uniref:TonB-dependent receptor n=1 Tax=Chitinophaga rhizophila TaxID=2866212 RepID=A0ABS7G632_9BACT|nr:TonB-dependent receptor [Chitinophaga rhizophila]MBW8683064.1 TonB-dependent receptor [Chitinophaga rhizophila]